MKKKKLPLWGVLLLVALYLFFGLGNDIPEAADPVMPVETTGLQTLPPDCAEEPVLDEEGSYTTKEDVALYIYTYGHLPQNFITKDQARKLGWNGG